MSEKLSKLEISTARHTAIQFGRTGDWIIAVVIIVSAMLFIYMLWDLPERAVFYPSFITISIMVVGGFYTINKIRRPDAWDAQYDPKIVSAKADADTGPAYLVPHLRAILRVFAVFIGFVCFTILLGPKFAVPAFVTLALWFNGENKLVAVGSGLVFFLIIHLVFGQFMSINLPIGIVQEYLR